jgi:pyruvate/2-oxoglutarate dehydrogenase complex dihydrolipoamide dehydrogenase (E3) component
MTKAVEMPPMDEFNKKLIANVHPGDWVNPEPKEKYHLVVIGAGTAGLVTAAGAAGIGAKVALIERHLMGGDCLNVGCVPSKCLIHPSRVMAEIRDAEEAGVKVPEGVTVDFEHVMQRLRKIRSHISRNDSAQRFKDLGVDVFMGSAKFISDGVIEVDGVKLNYKKAVIASGARAFVPPIPGLPEANPLTNETVFSLTEIPKRLAVIGAGPIGCELAQSFARLGSEVTILELAPQLLIREDRDAVEILAKSFEKDGIKIIFNAKTNKVSTEGDKKTLLYEVDGKEETLCVDQILIGAGRIPNVDGMGLETVGVDFDVRNGVKVNDNLQTSNQAIYACGDICLQLKFTHSADFAARIVIQNALMPWFVPKKRYSDLKIPWCTYTSPEVAHTGLDESTVKARNIEVDTYKIEFSDVDRAIAEGQEEGFVKILTEKGTDKIIGATIVAAHAGEMISEISVALVNGIGLGKIASVIHPYPTQAEAIRRLGDSFNKTKLTPFSKKVLGWMIGNP